MSAINEQLIMQLFDEIKLHKPSLEKAAIMEEDEPPDYRVYGDLIIKNFPWPIGVELRRLFSVSIRQLDRLRLDQIFKTIERTMQFLSFILLSQLWKDVASKQIILPDSFKNDFRNRFLVLALGNFTWFIRAIGNIYQKQKSDGFLTEINSSFTNEFYNNLDFWVPERNEIGHYQINLTAEEIEKRCVEYQEKLIYILKKLSFLVKYKLVSVNEIKVIKPKNRESSFQHHISLLNSSDSEFKAVDIFENHCSESHSILLMKTIKNIDEYLNLSPLVIDTHLETLDTKEKFTIKKDIFLYTKYRDGHLMYTGTEVTEKCDLRPLSNYQLLVEQFEELMAILTT